jgi:hypothetical protein
MLGIVPSLYGYSADILKNDDCLLSNKRSLNISVSYLNKICSSFLLTDLCWIPQLLPALETVNMNHKDLEDWQFDWGTIPTYPSLYSGF